MSYEHQKIGRGSAQVRMKVKNVRTGAIFDTTAQAGTKWPRIRLDQRQVQYLYSEGDVHYFMDKESYEQFPLSPPQLGDAVNYLKDGIELEVLMYEDEPVGVDMPLNVVLEVVADRPRLQGRHRHRRQQAGRARDGPDHQRAPVRQHRRQDPRRYARRLVHRTRVSPEGDPLFDRAGISGPRAGATC